MKSAVVSNAGAATGLMSLGSEAYAKENSDFLTTLDRHFPDWRLVEVFGPPGAGKTWLCEQLAGTPGLVTTANYRGLHYYAERSQWRATRALLPYLGRKVAKTYYGYWSRVLEKQTPALCGRAERDFLAMAIELLDLAPMPARTRAKMTRSLLRSTGLTICARNEGRRLVLDEGFVRRLVDIHWRMKAASASPRQFDRMKACVEQFPFERNAVAVLAPPELCVARQSSRGQVIASVEKPQSVFHDATQAVSAMCRHAGWRIVAIENP